MGNFQRENSLREAALTLTLSPLWERGFIPPVAKVASSSRLSFSA